MWSAPTIHRTAVNCLRPRALTTPFRVPGYFAKKGVATMTTLALFKFITDCTITDQYLTTYLALSMDIAQDQPMTMSVDQQIDEQVCRLVCSIVGYSAV